MVLQQGQKLPIWGWAEPGEAVSVTLEENREATKTNDAGEWRVDLTAIESNDKPLELNDDRKYHLGLLSRFAIAIACHRSKKVAHAENLLIHSVLSGLETKTRNVLPERGVDVACRA